MHIDTPPKPFRNRNKDTYASLAMIKPKQTNHGHGLGSNLESIPGTGTDTQTLSQTRTGTDAHWAKNGQYPDMVLKGFISILTILLHEISIH